MGKCFSRQSLFQRLKSQEPHLNSFLFHHEQEYSSLDCLHYGNTSRKNIYRYLKNIFLKSYTFKASPLFLCMGWEMFLQTCISNLKLTKFFTFGLLSSINHLMVFQVTTSKLNTYHMSYNKMSYGNCHKALVTHTSTKAIQFHTDLVCRQNLMSSITW